MRARSFRRVFSLVQRVVLFRPEPVRKGEDMAEAGIVQDEQKLKQRAMRRLAVALTFIALAIAGLAILDRYNASLKKPEIPTKPPELRALPGVPPGEQPRASPAPPLTPAPAPAQQAESFPPPPPPVVSNQPLPSPEPAPKASPTPSANPPFESTSKNPPAAATAPSRNNDQPIMASPAQPAASSPSSAGSKPSAAAQPRAVPAPVAAPAAAGQPAVAQPTTAPAVESAAKGFVVQVGVFTTAANARSLQEKLSAKGIRTHLETRLVVGPFQDRAEADAVVSQLKQMGLEGMVSPH